MGIEQKVKAYMYVPLLISNITGLEERKSHTIPSMDPHYTCTHIHTHKHTHTHTHTHKHMCARAHTETPARARTHTHIHKQRTYLVLRRFSRQSMITTDRHMAIRNVPMTTNTKAITTRLVLIASVVLLGVMVVVLESGPAVF